MRCPDFECIYQCQPSEYNGPLIFDILHKKICKIQHSKDKEDCSYFFCKYKYSDFSCNVQGKLSCSCCVKLFSCPNKYKNR